MKVGPLRTARFKPYALLTPGPGAKRLTVDTGEGRRVLSDRRDIEAAFLNLSGHVLYAPGKLRHFLSVTEPTDWALTTWRGRPVSMTHKPSGSTLTSLRGALNGAYDDAFTALDYVMQWLRGYGVAPGTVSSMAWNLFRASLEEDLTISFDPDVADMAFFGGRQEIYKPVTYYDMVAYDIKSAYPHAMSSAPFALGLREVSKSTTITDEAGLVAATVRVSRHLPYAPLPIRIGPRAITFPHGQFKGVWPWREVKAAKDLGCDVEVVKAWAPRRTADLFGPWWEMARSGRNLPPGADTLAKMIANSTWGQFAMRGEERHVLHFTGKGEDDYVVEVTPARKMPHVYAKHIAAEVTSRVRTQTLVEGLYGTSGTIAHVDTDGIIVERDAVAPSNQGDRFGQWRVKETMQEIDVRAPQLYRYRVPRDPVWRYVAAGMSLDGARKEFQRRRKEPTRISYLSEVDMVIPHSSDYHMAELLKEANRW